MSDRWFALTNLLIGGVFTLLVTGVSEYLSGRREAWRFRRDAALERIRQTQKLFKDVQLALVRVSLRIGKGEEDRRNEVRLSAQLNIEGDDEINDLFIETANGL